jgi:dCMP deaminase
MIKPIRPDKVEYFTLLAQVVAMRSTCPRRQVGCILVDYNDEVMSTGYNGTPKGMPHCIDKPCPGARKKSGIGLDLCEAVHAEQNALLQCKNTRQIKACYTTTFPCVHCIKLLMNTSCSCIYFLNSYKNMNESIIKWRESDPLRKVNIVPIKYIIKEL